VFDPERMIEPISVRWLDSTAAVREGALELCVHSPLQCRGGGGWTQLITWPVLTFTR